MKKTTPKHATAKAKLLREALQCAAREECSAQAQALLAVLIAESWPRKLRNGRMGWVTELGYPVLHRRLSTSISSIKRWADELETKNIVQRRTGSGHQPTLWLIERRPTYRPSTRGLTIDRPEGSPVNGGGVTSDRPEGSPMTTVFRLNR